MFTLTKSLEALEIPLLYCIVCVCVWSAVDRVYGTVD